MHKSDTTVFVEHFFATNDTARDALCALERPTTTSGCNLKWTIVDYFLHVYLPARVRMSNATYEELILFDGFDVARATHKPFDTQGKPSRYKESISLINASNEKLTVRLCRANLFKWLWQSEGYALLLCHLDSIRLPPRYGHGTNYQELREALVESWSKAGVLM